MLVAMSILMLLIGLMDISLGRDFGRPLAVKYRGTSSPKNQNFVRCDEDIRLNGSSFATLISGTSFNFKDHPTNKACEARVHVPMNYNIAYGVAFRGQCNDTINITIHPSRPTLQYKTCNSTRRQNIIDIHDGGFSISFPEVDPTGHSLYSFNIFVLIYFDGRYCRDGDYVCKIAEKYFCFPSEKIVNMVDYYFVHCHTNRPIKLLLSLFGKLKSGAPKPYLYVIVLGLFVFVLMFALLKI